MRLDQFEASALRGLYGFMAYPVLVEQRQAGAYIAGQGQGPATCTTLAFSGFVTKWQRSEIQGTSVPYSSAKLVLLRCDQDTDCLFSFTPKCGPYANTRFKLWRDTSGPFTVLDDALATLTLAVIPS